MKGYCEVHVWDNGDMEACGKPTMSDRNVYCCAHFEQRMVALDAAIAGYDAQISILMALRDDLRRMA